VHVTSLYPMAQKTFQNAEPVRHAHQLLPMFTGLGAVKKFFSGQENLPKIRTFSGHVLHCYLYNPRQFTHMKSHYGLVAL